MSCSIMTQTAALYAVRVTVGPKQKILCITEPGEKQSIWIIMTLVLYILVVLRYKSLSNKKLQ